MSYCYDTEYLVAFHSGHGYLGSLLARLGRSSLALSLGVNTSSEGVFEAQGKNVHGENLDSEEDTGRLAVKQGSSKKAHSRAPVHGCAGDVEGEASHHLIHQDAKVVTKKGTRDAKSPGGRDDEDVSASQQRVSGGLDINRLEERMRGLLGDGGLEDVVTDHAQTEDCGGKRVASGVGATSEEVRQELVVILLTRDDVPEQRIEGDGACRDYILG
jgi:hypothetical protein